MSEFKTVNIEDIKKSACEMIGKDWMLVTAAKDGKVNTMTASWGGIGVMWGKNVAFVVIRPQRYTKEFVDASETLSLTFYSEDKKKMLSYMGSVSGRDEDKIEKMGMTTVFDGETPYFEEADTVLIVRKMYKQVFKPECILDKEVDEKWYPNKDYHEMYICEIEKVMVKQ
ncbi:flavin reductase [Lachnospiraceae bacterium HCP1S3_C3]|mgnify:CR=1 FL=1|nr:flavin reductase [Lachnospiraceae bacterium]